MGIGRRCPWPLCQIWASRKEDHVLRDRYGDALPEGAVARMGTTRLRHSGWVQSMAFSPDGRSLASGGIEETLKIWEVDTGRLLHDIDERTWDKYLSGVSSVAFHPVADLLVYVAPIGKVRLWETVTWQEVLTIEEVTDAIQAIFSPDGSILAIGLSDCSVCFWDVWGRSPLVHVYLDSGPISLAFSPDGVLLVVATDDAGIFLIDVASGGKRQNRRLVVRP
jgi:WD40 repeat protein